MFPYLLFQEVGKIRQFKNLHSRKLPGREGSGIRKANWKAFSQKHVFRSRTRERDPRIPASISQKDFPAARKGNGRGSGRESIKSHIFKAIAQGPGLSLVCLPVISPQGKVQETDQVFQNTESRKVPGREKGVSRKANWKGYF